MEKTCCMCKKLLPVENFKSNTKRKDGLQSQCIECQKKYRRQHYLDNKEKYIDKARVKSQEIVTWWKEYKKQFSCVECGESHPACVQFHHHNDDKEANVSFLVRNASRKTLLEEISKCVVLCANCHAKKHWTD
jgi:acetylornithine/succinyldiaminopimelate/putrescine aminotransferase